ncbi:MAG TPA: chemotaxis protein CheR [Myxococcales bacterium]|jgi:chemotaxis protein methyltransferase CheR|nr:chemotaxis protein CheR [Myxococcales bacterium]
MNDADCVALLQWALPRLHLRWEGFRRVRGQVCKRIARRMSELGSAEVGEYRQRLELDPQEWRHFDSLCRVTISRFHRDRLVFERLGELLARRMSTGEGKVLRVWSAGCASGEEPYTVAILFRRRLLPVAPGSRLAVVATDVDAQLLERARIGCYARGSLRELPEEWREESFERVDGEWCIKARFREGIEWRCEDLRERMPDGPFAVILCRNLVFTYFDDLLQRRLLGQLLSRLGEGGLLVLGSHETLPGDRLRRLEPGVPIYG